MRYLGMDVHGKATVYCLVDAKGEVIERGSIVTAAPELTALIGRLALSAGELVCGQEVGTMSHFVHDIVTATRCDDSVVQRSAHSDDRGVSQEDGQARCVLACKVLANRHDAAPGAHTDRGGATPAKPPGATSRDFKRAKTMDAACALASSRGRYAAGEGCG